jgi:hypothetical protein
MNFRKESMSDTVKELREVRSKMTPDLKPKKIRLGKKDFYWQLVSGRRELLQTIVREIPAEQEYFDEDTANIAGFYALYNSFPDLLDRLEAAEKEAAEYKREWESQIANNEELIDIFNKEAAERQPNRVINGNALPVWKDDETGRFIAEFMSMVASGRTEEEAIASLQAVVSLQASLFVTGNDQAIAQSRPWIKVSPDTMPPTKSTEMARCEFYCEGNERNFSGYYDPFLRMWSVAHPNDEYQRIEVYDVTHWREIGPLPE